MCVCMELGPVRPLLSPLSSLLYLPLLPFSKSRHPPISERVALHSQTRWHVSWRL